MRWIGPTLLTIALAACEGGAGSSAADFGNPGDLAGADVPMLQDAVFLESGAMDPAGEDRGAFDLAWFEEAAADIGSMDTSIPEDFGAPPDVPAADTWEPLDVAADVPQPPDALPEDPGPNDAPCGDPEDLPCGPGATCVTGSDGSRHCAPVDQCSGDGAIDIEQLVILLMKGEASIPVKVLAMAWPGQPACGPVTCDPDHPCCNSCFAPLFIGADTFPIVLNGKGMAIGCQGNDCNVLDTCRPLVPRTWYWVWGHASIMGGKPQFTVEGFCPADTPAAGL